MPSVQTVNGVRGSKRTQRKKKPLFGKQTKTRRNREDVQIRHISVDGKVVTSSNMVGMLRSMMADEERPFAEMARETEIAGGIKSPGTLSKLFYGETQSPKLTTQCSVLGLYGYEMQIRKKRH